VEEIVVQEVRVEEGLEPVTEVETGNLIFLDEELKISFLYPRDWGIKKSSARGYRLLSSPNGSFLQRGRQLYQFCSEYRTFKS